MACKPATIGNGCPTPAPGIITNTSTRITNNDPTDANFATNSAFQQAFHPASDQSLEIINQRGRFPLPNG